jgi:hypothetical protein
MEDKKIGALPSEKQLRLKKIPKAKWEAMNRDLIKASKEREEEERRLESERWKPKMETRGTCSCGGTIILLTTYTSEYNPMTGPLIVGPGSRGQFSRVEEKECFCEDCGLLYNSRIVPKRKFKK